MIKRTFYSLTLLLILCVSGIQAQNTKFSKEEFRNRQKEFFIQQAGLSNDEAQKFFPLYFQRLLRRDRDSNPGYLAVQRFSRPPQSTTLPPLQNSFLNVALFFKSGAKVGIIFYFANKRGKIYLDTL